jgi:hypothetical protein
LFFFFSSSFSSSSSSSFFSFFFFYFFFESGYHNIAQAGFKLTVILPQPPECSDYRHAPLHLEAVLWLLVEEGFKRGSSGEGFDYPGSSALKMKMKVISFITILH